MKHDKEYLELCMEALKDKLQTLRASATHPELAQSIDDILGLCEDIYHEVLEEDSDEKY